MRLTPKSFAAQANRGSQCCFCNLTSDLGFSSGNLQSQLYEEQSRSRERGKEGKEEGGCGAETYRIVSVSRYLNKASMTPILVDSSDIPSNALEAKEVYTSVHNTQTRHAPRPSQTIARLVY